MHYSMIYITAKDEFEAKEIGRILLEQKLIACVNLYPHSHSMYWWQHEIEEAKETIVIAKTRRDLVSQVIAKVKELHSYECPCVISLPIEDGNPAYLDWIKEVTKS